MAIDILLNIWVKTAKSHPKLHTDAVSLFSHSQLASDRIWLHYGLTLLSYDFFRLATRSIGKILRYQEVCTPKEIKRRMFAEIGQLGAIEKATERVIFSLRDWGILENSGKRFVYNAAPRIQTANFSLEQWMLQIALETQPAEEVPFADLVRLPELFPFHFAIGIDDLRQTERFEVQRQGMGWDMVRLAEFARR
jgi:hypothetical protein